MDHMKSSNQNPYLFVVGCPRSGTTLLQRMLDNHPQLAVANDSHFIPRAIEDVPIGIDPVLTPELVEWVRSYRRFYRLSLSEADVHEAAAQARTYWEFVGHLYSAYGRRHGKPLAGEKTPDYVRHLPRLHALFPWVKTIHIIRDGRDVALSALEWAREDKGPGKFELWQTEPVAVCALWWRWQVSTGRRDGEGLGLGRYGEVRYEHLVARPEETLRGLTAFLNLPFAHEMLTYHEGRTRHEPGLSAKKAWLPPTSGLRDWRTQMTERDVELFEALAGDLLSALGYERSMGATSPGIAKVAEQCRRGWESERARQSANGGSRTDIRPLESSAVSGRLPRAPRSPMSETVLSPHDADLVRRDPALPGLATILDPAAVVAVLRQSQPEADLGTARITYVRYKPGTNCLAAYQLKVAGVIVDLYAKAYGPEAEVKLRNSRKWPSVPGPLGPGCVILKDYAIAVFIFPNDRKVKALPKLVDAQARKHLLHQLLPDRPELGESTLRGLAYKPERRYVAQLLDDNGSRAVVKAYTASGYQSAQYKADVLESRGALRSARPIGRSDRHALLLFEWLSGRLLSEVISNPEMKLEDVRAVGAALAELHAQSGDRLAQLTREAEAVALVEVASGLGVLCPPLANRAHDLAQRLAAQLASAPHLNRPIHGDFYAKQALLGDDGVAFLDLDEAVRGDPAADLGNFIAHLHGDALSSTVAPDRAELVRDALLEGYRLATNSPLPDRIELYTAAGLLRLSHEPFRHRQPDWPERTAAILERVEALLEAAHAH